MRDIKDTLSNNDLANLLNNIEEEKNRAINIRDKYIAERDYVMTCLIAFYGLTIEDIKRLNGQNIMVIPVPYIELDDRIIHISNALRLNIVNLTDHFREYMKDKWQIGESMFTAEEIDFDNQIQRYTRNLEKKVNFNELRTYCISSLINNFANLHKLKEYLGIDSIDDILPYYVGYPSECSETVNFTERLVMNLMKIEDSKLN